tara:strand:+ start:679 stop:879 length:201 start_codon:yes stop_codon:yes gene_type:complete
MKQVELLPLTPVEPLPLIPVELLHLIQPPYLKLLIPLRGIRVKIQREAPQQVGRQRSIPPLHLPQQ